MAVFVVGQTKENFNQRTVEDVTLPGAILGVTQRPDHIPLSTKAWLCLAVEVLVHVAAF
jgi:hypothetical protein